MSRNEAVTATWSIDLLVECPICQQDVDLLDDPDFFEETGIEIGEHQTARTDDLEVYCPQCWGRFRVSCEY